MYRRTPEKYLPPPPPPGRRRWSDPVPLSEPEVSLVRIRVFALVLCLGFLVLLSRLWFLQIYKGETFRDQADTNSQHPVRDVAPRGIIEDSRGKVLVTNSAQFTVFVDPAVLPKEEAEKQEILVRLAGILEISPDDLQTVLKRKKQGNNPIPVAEGVSDHVMARIAENRLYLRGVLTDVEPVRVYPQGTLASHLIGYIGPISPSDLEKEENQDLGYRSGDLIGQSGIEHAYDKYLNGKPGGTWYEVDARGRRKREIREEAVTAGATVRLALESEVQRAAENALAGRKGAAVAIDPRDGRVLAMASFPNFDPTLFARRPLPESVYKSLNEKGALFNLATQSEQPPGSTFKIVTSAAALASKTISANDYDYCSGGIWFGKKKYKKCHSTHGSVNLSRALEVSCDVFYYHAGMRMGPETLADWSKKFGLGQKTGIDLDSDKPGLVPSPDWKRAYAAKVHSTNSKWYQGETANMAIGQGAVLTTPLQMALVAGAIGNGGTIYAPRTVLKATPSKEGQEGYTMQPTVTHHLPLTPTQIHEIAQGMRQVIIGRGGTSHAANLAGIEVAGKSGSAETKTNGPTSAWFVCYAPFDHPTIAIAVFIDAGGQKRHGGLEAAPVARQMMAAHFHVPDRVSSLGGGSLAD